MTIDPSNGQTSDDPSAESEPRLDLAAEAERGRTPRTPFLALTGVWLTVASVAAVLIAAALALYFVYGGR